VWAEAHPDDRADDEVPAASLLVPPGLPDLCAGLESAPSARLKGACILKLGERRRHPKEVLRTRIEVPTAVFFDGLETV